MAVVTFETLRSEPYQGGMTFGDVGTYERIDGRLHVAVDPLHPRNAAIVDLDLAPRSGDGRVRFSGDVCLLIPADPERGARRLIVELPNRGRRRLPRYLLRAPIGAAGTADIPPGDGFLLRRGYAIAWIGWQWDVVRSEALMGLDAPLAFQDGRPLTGETILRFQPNAGHTTHLLADLSHQPYPTSDVHDPDAQLSVSDYRNGPRSSIPRERWLFASDLGGEVVADARYIYFAEGFQPGKVYDLRYTTYRAPVVGAGLLAVRDGASFLRYSRQAGQPAGRASRLDHRLRHLADGADAAPLPLAGAEPGRGGAHRLRRSIAERRRGAAGRVQPPLRPALDPADPQPRLPSALRRRSAAGEPACDRRRAEAGADQRLGRVLARGHAPTCISRRTARATCCPTRIRASTTSPAHSTIPARSNRSRRRWTARSGRYRYNWVDYTPLLRAALVNLDRWVSEGIAPPPSAHPRLADETLAPRDEVLGQFADGRVPGLHLPDAERLPYLWQVDPGPDAAAGVVRFPVEVTGTRPAFVSAIDADGNETGGLRLPDLTVPLATLTGWNPRDPSTGAPEQILDYKGATHPFPRTRAEREAAGDPRPSIEERYPDRAAYLALVAEQADALIAQGYILPEDREALLADAETRYREATR